MRSRPLLAALAVLVLIAIAGCGGGSSSGSKVADLAPPGVPIFVEGELRPTGELKSNTDAITKKVGGIGNLGDFIVEKFESSAEGNGEPVDFAGEIEPWLGERGGLFFKRLDEDNEVEGIGLIAESTDPGAAEEFVSARAKSSKDPYRAGSYEGADFEVGGADGRALGVVGDFFVMTEDEEIFKEVVDASEGEALADEDTFSEAISAASDGSLADVFVDVGKLIEQSGGRIDPTVRQLLQNAGIDPSEATAVASIVPGTDHVTVDLSSDLGGKEAPTGDASALLGELPGNAFAGFAVSGFGKQLSEALDSLDKEGIPGTIPPGQLKAGLKQLGIDLEGLAGSVEDAGVFAVGETESALGGALVLSTKGAQAVETISSIVKLLRAAHVEGVSVLGGKYAGFSVHSKELGKKPLVVAANEGRIAIGYGLPATLEGLLSGTGSARTLSEDPAYGDAVDSLGDTPISGFVGGPAALSLADALVPSSNEGFEEAKKYLQSISFLALGSAKQEDLATAQLIIGLK